MENQQPETLETASQIELAITCGFIGSAEQYDHLLLSAVSHLRRLHARVEELEEAMLDAVGAGGVSAQRVTKAKWTGTLRGEDCKHEVFDDGVKTMIPRNPAFVRITHIPTGVTVECRDDERSSHRNSANAWLMLEAKLKEKKKLDFSSDTAAMLRIKAIQKAADHIEQPIEMVAAPIAPICKKWGIKVGTNLYTEQQVRELLAAHGIPQKKRSNDKEEQQWQ